MDNEKCLQTVREIRRVFPSGVFPPPDTLENTRRHRADSETQLAPRKKAQIGNGQGSNMEMEQVRGINKLPRLMLISQQPGW